MIILAYIALIGWIPCVIFLFAIMPARVAATIAIIGAWLLLPPIGLSIVGLPDYTKTTAAMIGVILGTIFFAPNRLMNFRLRWFDLPMLLWCFSGVWSSLYNASPDNELGLYDGLADALNQIVTWGLPYFLGRLYLGELDSLRSFGVAMVIGSLSYVLPCVWEMRMSPQLLRQIYGVGSGGGVAAIRLGGYRPNVFFRTGLELGLWMTATLIMGWWLWRSGVIKRIGQFPFGSVLLPILAITTILCRSTGALALLAVGISVLWLSTRFQTRLLMIAVLLVGPLYVTIRVTGAWSGRQAVNLVSTLVGPERAESLEYRFKCENLLIAKAVQQPVFGWGGWGRSAAYFGMDTRWPKQVPTDGIWIIYLGTKGYFGLTLFYLALTLPAVLFVWRFPARLWSEPNLAAASVAATLLALYMIDCLMNGFVNVIYLTLAGGLVGLEPKQLQSLKSRRKNMNIHMNNLTTSPAVVLPSGVARANPENDPAILADQYHILGRSFNQQGRRDDAESTWRRALDMLSELLKSEPNSPELRRLWCDCANDLAWLWANHPDTAHRKLDAAITFARQMVEEFPDAAEYWNTLGVAYYRADDATAAVNALECATTLNGGTAFDDIFLAMAHAKLGDLKTAHRQFTRAVTRAEQDHPHHLELSVFCDEARSILAQCSGTAGSVH